MSPSQNSKWARQREGRRCWEGKIETRRGTCRKDAALFFHTPKRCHFYREVLPRKFKREYLLFRCRHERETCAPARARAPPLSHTHWRASRERFSFSSPLSKAFSLRALQRFLSFFFKKPPFHSCSRAKGQPLAARSLKKSLRLFFKLKSGFFFKEAFLHNSLGLSLKKRQTLANTFFWRANTLPTCPRL